MKRKRSDVISKPLKKIIYGIMSLREVGADLCSDRADPLEYFGSLELAIAIPKPTHCFFQL